MGNTLLKWLAPSPRSKMLSEFVSGGLFSAEFAYSY